MAYQISDNCLGCGACVVACAVDAIYADNRKFKIDEEKCISCGACTDLCPISAISEKLGDYEHESSSSNR